MKTGPLFLALLLPACAENARFVPLPGPQGSHEPLGVEEQVRKAGIVKLSCAVVQVTATDQPDVRFGTPVWLATGCDRQVLLTCPKDRLVYLAHLGPGSTYQACILSGPEPPAGPVVFSPPQPPPLPLPSIQQKKLPVNAGEKVDITYPSFTFGNPQAGAQLETYLARYTLEPLRGTFQDLVRKQRIERDGVTDRAQLKTMPDPDRLSLHTECRPTYATARAVSVVCQVRWELVAVAEHLFSLTFLIRDGQVTPMDLRALFQANSEYREFLSRLAVPDLQAQGARFADERGVQQEIDGFHLIPEGLVLRFAEGKIDRAARQVVLPYGALSPILRRDEEMGGLTQELLVSRP